MKEKKIVARPKARARSSKVSKVAKSADTPAVPEPRSNNEKAILISLAYLIGFLTAYIAFFLNAPVDQQQNWIHYDRPVSVTGISQVAASGGVRAVANEEGLFVVNNGVERIISVKRDAGQYELGFHRDVVSTAVSVDDNFVHYCSVMTAADGECSNFVYVVDEDKVYRVSDPAGPLNTSVPVARSAKWTSTNLLTIGERSSVNAATPWVLQ